MEENWELIKSLNINSVAVGNPSTPCNQPTHRNVLQRKNKRHQSEIDSHLLLQLLPEAAERGASAEVHRKLGRGRNQKV